MQSILTNSKAHFELEHELEKIEIDINGDGLFYHGEGNTSVNRGNHAPVTALKMLQLAIQARGRAAHLIKCADAMDLRIEDALK